MAKLKASEKRLLIIFVVGLFLVVNYFVYGEYASRFDGMVGKERTLRLQKEKFRLMLNEREEWIDRRDWVVRRLPQYRTIDDRDTHLVTLVRNAVNAAGLEIAVGPNPLPTTESENFEETLVNVTVDGEIEPLVRFLHSLQDPEQFRSLTSLQMLPAKKDSSEIRCELTLAQWWSLEGPSVAAGTEEDVAGGNVPAGEAPVEPGGVEPEPVAPETSPAVDPTPETLPVPLEEEGAPAESSGVGIEERANGFAKRKLNNRGSGVV